MVQQLEGIVGLRENEFFFFNVEVIIVYLCVNRNELGDGIMFFFVGQKENCQSNVFDFKKGDEIQCVSGEFSFL